MQEGKEKRKNSKEREKEKKKKIDIVRMGLTFISSVLPSFSSSRPSKALTLQPTRRAMFAH
jgi:hypothetical protein